MCALAHPRKVAFDRQHGRCIYCGLPMWIVSAAELTSKFAISHAQARRLQCTAEHVIAKCDGGSNAAANIAASCHQCNQGRHARKFPLSSEEFKKHVRSRMTAGRWHSRDVLRALPLPRFLTMQPARR